MVFLADDFFQRTGLHLFKKICNNVVKNLFLQPWSLNF